MFFVGLDDTDNLESRGTGHLARQIAGALAEDWSVLGVTHHQLLVDPCVPYTKNNSASAIVVRTNDQAANLKLDVTTVAARVWAMMLVHPTPGSDPGRWASLPCRRWMDVRSSRAQC
jgi:tRNA(Ile2) C34 agmatinyltransferase TiaS